MMILFDALDFTNNYIHCNPHMQIQVKAKIHPGY